MLIFNAHPRTVGVTPLIGTLRESARRFRAGIYIATRRHRVLSRMLRIFSVVPSCSLGVVTPGRSLCSVAAGILLNLHSILGSFYPSAILMRKSAAASVTTSLTTFCQRITIKRIRTNLHACSVLSP